MLKFVRLSLAIVLGIVISLSLLTEGVFAQNVSPDQTGQATHVLVPAITLQGVKETTQAFSANPQLSHQGKRKVSQQIVCARFYRSVRVYRHGRWVTVCVRA
jgi:hypothetical protein